jgi:hypothetical protein
MKYHLAQTTVALFAMASLVPCAEAADKHFMSVPRDTHIYSRPAIHEDLRPLPTAKALAPVVAEMLVVDAVVNNTNPALRNTDTIGGTEVSVAATHQGNPRRIVLTAFSGPWGTTAPLWRSTNGGLTWTKEFTINPPPGAGGVTGCPCDQTVDFNPITGHLAGTFLTSSFTTPCTLCNIYSAVSSNLTISPGAFDYFTLFGAAQATTHIDGLNNEDQPWLLVGRRPGETGENVYVAYDDFNTAPDMRVAVGHATIGPLQFTTDNRSGFATGFVNPGHRLAVDHSSGAVYSLFQRRIAAGAGGSQNIDYMLNRSTDGGKTWTLNGSTTGIVVANADSTQPQPKFCTVNALLGGAEHAAVDPVTGDVVYVYGNRDATTGNNRLAMRRLTPTSEGGLTIGPQIFITGQVQAAIPSVAITANRVIGVFYYTCDGTSPPTPPSTSGFPIITAHFSTSTDQGTTFFDNTLESFLSPALDNRVTGQRVLGDFAQVKAVGNTFFGGFAGNRVGFYPLSPISIIDPIFFKVETREEP